MNVEDPSYTHADKVVQLDPLLVCKRISLVPVTIGARDRPQRRWSGKIVELGEGAALRAGCACHILSPQRITLYLGERDVVGEITLWSLSRIVIAASHSNGLEQVEHGKLALVPATT